MVEKLHLPTLKKCHFLFSCLQHYAQTYSGKWMYFLRQIFSKLCSPIRAAYALDSPQWHRFWNYDHVIYRLGRFISMFRCFVEPSTASFRWKCNRLKMTMLSHACLHHHWNTTAKQPEKKKIIIIIMVVLRAKITTWLRGTS